MIKIDEMKIEMSGGISKVISETASLMHKVCKIAEDEVGIPYEETLDMMLKTQHMYGLVDSGMSYQEAIDIVGLDGVKIKEKQDNEFKEIKRSK